jgi:hypothetical protein
VGGVGDELALCVQARVQPGEEPVDRVCELPQVIGGTIDAEPFPEAGSRDPLGGRGNAAQRAQRTAGGEPAEGDRDGRHGREGDAGVLKERVVLRCLGSGGAAGGDVLQLLGRRGAATGGAAADEGPAQAGADAA